MRGQRAVEQSQCRAAPACDDPRDGFRRVHGCAGERDVSGVLAKLGLRDGVQAVVLACESGLVMRGG